MTRPFIEELANWKGSKREFEDQVHGVKREMMRPEKRKSRT
jgi:hypothetical protein